MSKLIKNRDGNFTHVKNDIFDSGLSAKAMGLFMYMWHKPDDWQFYTSELINHFKEGRDSIRKGLRELEDAGFLKREQDHKSESGKFNKYDWQLNESPVTEKPAPEKPLPEKPAPVNRTLLSTEGTKYLKQQSTDVTNLSRSSATSPKKREKPQTKLQSSYSTWTTRTNQQLTDLAMQYTKERASDTRHELAYFNTLMNDWTNRGFKTATEVKNYLSSKNSKHTKQPKSNVIQPDWLRDDYVEPEQPEVTEEDHRRVAEMLKKFD